MIWLKENKYKVISKNEVTLKNPDKMIALLTLLSEYNEKYFDLISADAKYQKYPINASYWRNYGDCIKYIEEKVLGNYELTKEYLLKCSNSYIILDDILEKPNNVVILNNILNIKSEEYTLIKNLKDFSDFNSRLEYIKYLNFDYYIFLSEIYNNMIFNKIEEYNVNELKELKNELLNYKFNVDQVDDVLSHQIEAEKNTKILKLSKDLIK